jgi:calcineurin-like phosphoesterase family protein
MTIYITSDLHFRHKNILKFNPDTRPFDSIEDMEDKLIEEINSLPNCEYLYHLGDFFFGNKNQLSQVTNRIKQKIVFLAGNHDKGIVNQLAEKSGNPVDHYKEIKWNGKKVCMFHFPIASWNMMEHGSLLLYGHMHGCVDYDNKSLDVGYDNHGRILTLDEACEMADSKPLNRGVR